MSLANGEPIHVPPPPIPSSNQSANDLIAALSNQEGGRGLSNQALDVTEAIDRSCVLAPRFSP